MESPALFSVWLWSGPMFNYVIRFLHKCQHSKKKLQNFVIIDNNGPQTFQKILHIENRLNSSDLFSFIDFSL